MALSHSPKIVTDGLVFYYDMENSQKSWKGAPTTNISDNNSFYSNWANSGTGAWSSNDLTISRLFKDLPLLSLLVTATGNLHISHARASITAGSTYTVSTHIYIPSSAGTLAGSVPYIRTDPANTGRGTLAYNGNTDWNTWPKDQWIRISQTFTNTANDTALYISCYLNTLDNKVYFTGPQVENLNFMSPFTGGAGLSRSNAQALLDLTGQNTITANSLTYASNGTFNFNGSSNYITIQQPSIQTSPNRWTISGWIKPTANQDCFFLTPQSAGIDHFLAITPSGQFRLQVTESADINNRGYYSPAGTVPAGSWTHFSASIDNLTIKLLLNGVEHISQTETIGIADWIGNWIIGQRGNNTFWLNGSISGLSVYNRALSAGEVQQNFNATRSRYGI